MPSPWEKEAPYGTRRTINGKACVYMPDPWTFPEGYGNVWASIDALIEDKIPIPKEPEAA